MLVDTYTMTVTLFSVIKSSVAVFLCGEEGDMQRAFLCSYEWTNNTLYRETVSRIESRVYCRMSHVGRVRLSLQTRRYLDILIEHGLSYKALISIGSCYNNCGK